MSTLSPKQSGEVEATEAELGLPAYVCQSLSALLRTYPERANWKFTHSKNIGNVLRPMLLVFLKDATLHMNVSTAVLARLNRQDFVEPTMGTVTNAEEDKEDAGLQAHVEARAQIVCDRYKKRTVFGLSHKENTARFLQPLLVEELRRMLAAAADFNPLTDANGASTQEAGSSSSLATAPDQPAKADWHMLQRVSLNKKTEDASLEIAVEKMAQLVQGALAAYMQNLPGLLEFSKGITLNLCMGSSVAEDRSTTVKMEMGPDNQPTYVLMDLHKKETSIGAMSFKTHTLLVTGYAIILKPKNEHAMQVCQELVNKSVEELVGAMQGMKLF